MNLLGYLTVKEAAEQLGLSVRSVHTLVAKGKIKVCRLGPKNGRLWFRLEDLKAYAESQFSYGPRA